MSGGAVAFLLWMVGFLCLFGGAALKDWLSANARSHTDAWREQRLVAWIKKDLPTPTPPVSWDYVERRLAEALERGRTLDLDDIVDTAQYADDVVFTSGGTEKVWRA